MVRLYTLEKGGEEFGRRLIAKSTAREGGSWSANCLEKTEANSSICGGISGAGLMGVGSINGYCSRWGEVAIAEMESEGF